MVLPPPVVSWEPDHVFCLSSPRDRSVSDIFIWGSFPATSFVQHGLQTSNLFLLQFSSLILPLNVFHLVSEYIFLCFSEHAHNGISRQAPQVLVLQIYGKENKKYTEYFPQSFYLLLSKCLFLLCQTLCFTTMARRTGICQAPSMISEAFGSTEGHAWAELG